MANQNALVARFSNVAPGYRELSVQHDWYRLRNRRKAMHPIDGRKALLRRFQEVGRPAYATQIKQGVIRQRHTGFGSGKKRVSIPKALWSSAASAMTPNRSVASCPAAITARPNSRASAMVGSRRSPVTSARQPA